MTNHQLKNTDPSRIPTLRFKEFEGEFSFHLYGDVFSFYPTNSFSRENLNYENGEVYNIHYGDIHTKFDTLFFLEQEETPYINQDVNITRVKKDSFCKEGDIVIADASEDYNDIGKSIEIIKLNNNKVLAGLHTFLARPIDDKVAIGFPSYLFQSWNVRKQIMTIAQGTKVLGISKGRLSGIHLHLPSLPEQQKIASFLSAVDRKIRQLTRKKELLEQYKKGVMQRLFPRKPGEASELRFKDENNEDFPDWEEKRYGDIFSFYRSNSLSRDQLNYNNGDVLNLHYGDIHTKFLPLFNVNKEYVPYVNQDIDVSKISEDSYCQVGDIVIADASEDYSDIGKCIEIVDLNNKKVIAGLHTFLARPLKSRMYLGFTTYLVQSWYVRKQIMTIAQGIKVLSISKGRLSNIILPIPSIEEQQKIASFFSGIDEKIGKVEEQIEKMKEFKKGLLQQMFI